MRPIPIRPRRWADGVVDGLGGMGGGGVHPPPGPLGDASRARAVVVAEPDSRCHPSGGRRRRREPPL